MKKKRLSQQQLSRIQQMQDNRATQALQNQAPITDDNTLGPEREGLVITHFGQQLDIEALDGEDRGKLHRCFQRSNMEPLVTGDRVIWQAGDPSGVVVAIQPRRSLLQRPNKYNELKPVAANIDCMVVVIASLPEAHANLIDRYLVAAVASNIEVLLLLNKTDLLDDDNRDDLLGLLDLYKRLGYATTQVSCHKGQGLGDLHALLRGHTSIFVGQSGVGKSALVNALLPSAQVREGALSESVLKGRHTTTAARLYHLPDGGDLIDSPGIREFGMWHMDAADVIHGFVEFRPFIGQCKFTDCRHEYENDCRILQAANEGLIDPRRLYSFQSIRNSMESQ
jgi:ribosome biogenesis GTPase / thiamine phosphate phosphatase